MNQFLGSMKKTLLYAGMSPKDYRLICPDMRKENRRQFRIKMRTRFAPDHFNGLLDRHRLRLVLRDEHKDDRAYHAHGDECHKTLDLARNRRAARRYLVRLLARRIQHLDDGRDPAFLENREDLRARGGIDAGVLNRALLVSVLYFKRHQIAFLR